MGGNLETIQARSSEVEKGGNITSEGITNDGSALPMSQKSLEEVKMRPLKPGSPHSPMTQMGPDEDGTPLIVEGHSTSKQGGVKIGRLATTVHPAYSRPNLKQTIALELEP